MNDSPSNYISCPPSFFLRRSRGFGANPYPSDFAAFFPRLWCLSRPSRLGFPASQPKSNEFSAEKNLPFCGLRCLRPFSAWLRIADWIFFWSIDFFLRGEDDNERLYEQNGMLKCWTRIFIYFASATLELHDWFTDRYLLYDVGNSLMEALSCRQVLHNYGHSKLLLLSRILSLSQLWFQFSLLRLSIPSTKIFRHFHLKSWMIETVQCSLILSIWPKVPFLHTSNSLNQKCLWLTPPSLFSQTTLIYR